MRRDYFSGSAENLALFRVVVALLLLGSGDLARAPEVAALPASLRVAPEGAAWLAALPVREGAAQCGVALVRLAALFGLVGLWARPAFAVATGVGVYTFGVAQLGGAVWHCHHLLWWSALLCASPCSDALSIDAWWTRRRGRGLPLPDVCYGLPLRIAWVLFGVMFFFPGLWKLRASGLAWISSDNLRDQMYGKWLQLGGFVPLLRIDRVPHLCRVLAALVVMLELCFPGLVLMRRSRPFAVFAALLFHLGAWLYMGIDYSNLWPGYVVFFDWTPLFSRLYARLDRDRGSSPRVQPAHSLGPTLIVGVVLITGSVVQGIRGRMDSWPFACYPTFQRLAPKALPVLLVDAVGRDGETVELPRPWQLGARRGPQTWALNWSALGLLQHPVMGAAATARLHGYWDQLRAQPEAARRLPANLCAVRFYRALLPVQPESWSAEPSTRTLLHTLALPCRSGGSSIPRSSSG